MPRIGEVIKQYRQKAELSQEELAEKLGVLRVAVTRWELGTRTPNAEYLLKLMAVLHIPPTAFDEFNFNKNLKGARKMRKEHLFLTNEDVEINEELTVQVDGYKETAVTTDGRIIGFDDAASGWVELGVYNG